MIDAAVANMREVDPSRTHPTQTERGSHTAELRVSLPQFSKFAVYLIKKLSEQILIADRDSICRCTEGLWQKLCDFLYRDLAGEFARVRSPHTITDGKNIVTLIELRLTVFTEAAHALAIERQREKGILVIFAEASDIA